MVVRARAIVTLLMGQGLRLLGIGVMSGLGGALIAMRYIESQLFGVTTRVDPVIAIRRT